MSDHDTWNMFFAAAFTVRFGSHVARDKAMEYAAKDADALLAESKKRETPAPTPPQPDDDGWIKWEGGECPVPHGTLVDLRHGDGDEYLAVTAGITNVATRWDVDPFCPHPGDIRAYRISDGENG